MLNGGKTHTALSLRRRRAAAETAAPALAPALAGERQQPGSLIVSNAVCQCVSASNRRSRRVLKASLSTVAGTGVAVAAAAAAPAFDAGRAHLFYKMAASSYLPRPRCLGMGLPTVPCDERHCRRRSQDIHRGTDRCGDLQPEACA